MLDEESDKSCDNHHDAIHGAARLPVARSQGLGALSSIRDGDGGSRARTTGVGDGIVVGRGAGQSDCGGSSSAKDGRAQDRRHGAADGSGEGINRGQSRGDGRRQGLSDEDSLLSRNDLGDSRQGVDDRDCGGCQWLGTG